MQYAKPRGQGRSYPHIPTKPVALPLVEPCEPRQLLSTSSLPTRLPPVQPPLDDTSLTPVLSFIPTTSQVGQTFGPSATSISPLIFGNTNAPAATAHRFGWKTSTNPTDDGASLLFNTSLNYRVPDANTAATLGSGAARKSAVWVIDQPLLLNYIKPVGSGNGITLARIDRFQNNSYDPITEIRALPPTGNAAPISLFSGFNGTVTGYSLPMNQPLVLRLVVEQLAAANWSFRIQASYSTSIDSWQPLGSLSNVTLFNSPPATIRVGPLGSGGGIESTGRWGGVILSKATSAADATDPVPLGSGWGSFFGATWYVDAEKTTPGVGTKDNPASVAHFLAGFNGNASPKPTTVWQRNGLNVDPNVHPDYSASSLADEFDARTFTLHPDVPTIKFLAKNGIKQRIAGTQIIDINNPAHITTDTPGTRPALWQTKAVTAWAPSSNPSTPNVYQTSDTFSHAYLFQDNLPLLTAAFSDTNAAQAWVNSAPGRFWNSETTLYLNPRNAINPTTAPAGTFERSIVSSTDVTGIVLTAQGILSDIAVYGTAIKRPASDDAIGGYAFGARPVTGIAVVQNMLGDLADKHTSGATINITGHTTVLWLDNLQGRSTPYGIYGAQTLRVDFIGNTDLYPGATYRTIYRRDADLYPTHNTYPTNGTNIGLNRADAFAYYSHYEGKTAISLRADSPGTSQNLSLSTTALLSLRLLGMTGGTSTVPAWGGITLASQPTPGQTLTLRDGLTTTTLTFVTALTSTNQVLIGTNTAATRDNLIAAINAAPIALTATNQASPIAEIVIEKSLMTAGGTIDPGYSSVPLIIRDSTVFGVTANSNVLIERSTLSRMPFSFSGTITDSHIKYSPTNPTDTSDSTRLPHAFPATAPRIHQSQHWLRNTFDMSALTPGSSTTAIHYLSGSLTLTGQDNLLIFPTAPINLFNATPSQVILNWTNTHILAPSPAGPAGTNILLGISAASHAASTGGAAYHSYSAAGIHPTTLRLTANSPLIGRGTPAPNTPDRTGITLPTRNDLGAYEFIPTPNFIPTPRGQLLETPAKHILRTPPPPTPLPLALTPPRPYYGLVPGFQPR
jgi:hypothetical protein